MAGGATSIFCDPPRRWCRPRPPYAGAWRNCGGTTTSRTSIRTTGVIAQIITEADPHLLVPLKEDILALPAFPPELEQDLLLQVERAGWDWPTGWKVLQDWASKLRDAERISGWEYRQIAAMVGVLGQFRQEGGSTILSLLQRHYRGHDKFLMQWMDMMLVDLAGTMRLEAAIPLLVERLHEEDEAVIEQVPAALVKIGTEEAVRALAADWPHGDASYGYSAMGTFEGIHCDLSVETALRLLREEQEVDVACGLGLVLLSNFAENVTEFLRDVVLESFAELEQNDDPYTGQVIELQQRLVAVATLLNQTFREYPEWYQEATASKWGRDYEQHRLSDDLGPHPAKRKKLVGGSRNDAVILREQSFPALGQGGKKIGLNDPCPCGSGKKYRACCLRKKPFDPNSN